MTSDYVAHQVHFTSWNMPLAGRVEASDFHTRVVPGAGPGAMSGGAVATGAVSSASSEAIRGHPLSAVSSGTRWEAWVVSASPGALGLRSGGFEAETPTMPISSSQLHLPKLGSIELPKLGSTELPKFGSTEESVTTLDGDDGGHGGNGSGSGGEGSGDGGGGGGRGGGGGGGGHGGGGGRGVVVGAPGSDESAPVTAPTFESIQRYARASLQARRAAPRAHDGAVTTRAAEHERHGERILCMLEPDSEGGAERLPRYVGRDECTSWRFRAGEPLTIIAFVEAPDAPSAMHVAWLPVVSFDDVEVLNAEARLGRKNTTYDYGGTRSRERARGP